MSPISHRDIHQTASPRKILRVPDQVSTLAALHSAKPNHTLRMGRWIFEADRPVIDVDRTAISKPKPVVLQLVCPAPFGSFSGHYPGPSACPKLHRPASLAHDGVGNTQYPQGVGTCTTMERSSVEKQLLARSLDNVCLRLHEDFLFWRAFRPCTHRSRVYDPHFCSSRLLSSPSRSDFSPRGSMLK